MSALDRQSPVVGAIIAALLGDAGLATLIGRRVYDAPPARAVMPSVTIKLVGGADASSADTEAQTLVFDLDVWDRYEAGANLDRPRAVMARMRSILHMRNLVVPGLDVVLARCTDARGPFRDPDELALHGVVTLSVLAGHETTLP